MAEIMPPSTTSPRFLQFLRVGLLITIVWAVRDVVVHLPGIADRAGMTSDPVPGGLTQGVAPVAALPAHMGQRSARSGPWSPATPAAIQYAARPDFAGDDDSHSAPAQFTTPDAPAPPAAPAPTDSGASSVGSMASTTQPVTQAVATSEAAPQYGVRPEYHAPLTLDLRTVNRMNTGQDAEGNIYGVYRPTKDSPLVPFVKRPGGDPEPITPTNGDAAVGGAVIVYPSGVPAAASAAGSADGGDSVIVRPDATAGRP
jgi:hypothetical protein